MAEVTRLQNLRKLYHVPVFALRDLVLAKMEADDERLTEVKRMTQVLLIQEADRNPKITDADINELHEAYRYGRRLSFQLYLLQAHYKITVLPEDIQAGITAVLEEQKIAHDAKKVEKADAEEVEDIRNVTICDYETFGDILELRYRYQVALHYRDENEEPAHVYDTQYGFIWLNTTLNYLVFLSRDEKVNKSLMTGLQRALKALPHPATLPKELINEHFPLEHVRRVAHLDPITGVRQSVSGESEGLKPHMAQILARETSQSRESALYDEEIVEGVNSKLGVNPRKGRIYIQKMLPASTIREWAQVKFPELVADLREWAEKRTAEGSTICPAINRMRISSMAKVLVNHIVDAIAQAKNEQQEAVHLHFSSLELYSALGGKHLTLSVQNECEECGEPANLCPNCLSSELAIIDNTLQCAECGTGMLQGCDVALTCPNEHDATLDINQVLYIMPVLGLEAVVTKALASIGVTWVPGQERFWIVGQVLYISALPSDNKMAVVAVGRGAVAIGNDFNGGDIITGDSR